MTSLRFMGALGCLLVALDCASHATEGAANLIFAAGNEWIWWFIAAAWLWVSLRIFFSRAS